MLPDTPTCCEPRQQQLDALLASVFSPPPVRNRRAHRSGMTANSWFDRLLTDCANAPEGQRSERDFALCIAASRHGFNAEEIWARVSSTGKFAEQGRRYFDTTWQRASETAANDPPQRRAECRGVLVEAAPTDAVQLPDNAPSLLAADGRTDRANARRFVHMHGAGVHWVDPWEKWLIWDGRRWSEDQQLRVEALAKQVADDCWQWLAPHLRELQTREAAELIRWAKYMASSRGASQICWRRSRSEPGIAVLPKHLDAHPWLFNCGNGTVDLRSGALLPHERTHLLTKLTAVEFPIGAASGDPVWQNTLNRIFGGDHDLVCFVRRLLGSALAGTAAEQILAIFFGGGSNGKSVLVETLLTVLGDYGDKASAELLLVKRGDSHPTEKADLFGKRLVFAVESDDGRAYQNRR